MPGYEFRTIDAMITNFHLPQSSLLMLVAAFAGTERILGAYRHAVAEFLQQVLVGGIAVGAFPARQLHEIAAEFVLPGPERAAS